MSRRDSSRDGPAAEAAEGFLSRWSRRKVQAKDGQPQPTEPPVVAPPPVPAARPQATGVTPPTPATARAPAGAERPLPTLADVAKLTRESDYSPFMAGGVDETVKRAALKKLFSDPSFNVMDGLDVYIDDYGKPDPISLATLRKMVPSSAFGLDRTEEETPSTAGAPDEDAAVERTATADQAVAPAGTGHARDPSDTAGGTVPPAASPTTVAPQPTTSQPAPDDPAPLAEAARHDEDADLQLQPDDAARRRPSV